MNTVNLTGNIATDVEPRKLPGDGDTSVVEARIAVRKRKRGDGPDAVFLDFKAYGKTADLLAQYTGKGSRIGITGRIDVDQWTDKESGDKRSKTYVVVEEVEFLDSKPAATGQAPAEAAA